MQPLLLVVPLPFQLLDGIGLIEAVCLWRLPQNQSMENDRSLSLLPAENQTFTGETILLQILLLKTYNIYELFDRRQEFMLK